MSAWTEIVNRDGSDEWLDLCNRALNEMQANQLRRSTRLIRECNPDRSPEFSDGVQWAADLIDPEKG